MIQYGLSSEIRRFFVIVIGSIILGLVIGHPLLFLGLSLLAYLAYHCYMLLKLLSWLKHPRKKDLPEDGAIWGEIFDELYRHRRREEREKSRLRGIIERINSTTAAIDDAILILDEKNSLSWWNQAAVDLLKLKSSDAGNSIINYIRMPRFVKYLDEGDYELPITFPSPLNLDKQLEFRITKFGKGESLMVVRDVSRVHRLEQMRKDFVANVGHELRTPLTVIRGYLEMLEPVGGKGSVVPVKALKQMQQQSSRMTNLINDLTMLSKLETDRPKDKPDSVMLKPLLEMICDEARVISGDKNQNIALHCLDDLMLLGNDRELHSAFSNLVTNAVKYSTEHKNITVTARLLAGGDCAVEVKDEGVGIESQHISRLTERFYRVDTSRSIETGGTGLGLAIVKHILLRHEAYLQVKSNFGEGSEFCCVFPSSRVIFSEKQLSG